MRLVDEMEKIVAFDNAEVAKELALINSLFPLPKPHVLQIETKPQKLCQWHLRSS